MDSPLNTVLERLFDDASSSSRQPPHGRGPAPTRPSRPGPTGGWRGRSCARPPGSPSSTPAWPPACPRPSVGVVGYDEVLRLEAGLRHPGPRPGRGPALRSAAAAGRVRLYVELAPRDDLDRWLDAIAAAGGHRVKVQGTGPTRHAVPSCGWLAEVLVGCRSAGAGPQGGGRCRPPLPPPGRPPHHGIVNLLAAACSARSGAPPPPWPACSPPKRARPPSATPGSRSSCPRSPPAPSRPRQVAGGPG